MFLGEASSAPRTDHLEQLGFLLVLHFPGRPGGWAANSWLWAEDAAGLCPPGNSQTASVVLLARGFPDFLPSLRETWEEGVGMWPNMHGFKMKRVISKFSVLPVTPFCTVMFLSHSHSQRGCWLSQVLGAGSCARQQGSWLRPAGPLLPGKPPSPPPLLSG